MSATKQVSFYAYASTANGFSANVTFAGAGTSTTLPPANSGALGSGSLQIGGDETTTSQVVQIATVSAEQVALNIATDGLYGAVQVYKAVTEQVPNLNPNAENFTWQATVSNAQVANASVSIDPVSGGLAGQGIVNVNNTALGLLNSIGKTPSFIGPQYALSYGFFDSSSGWNGLTNADQSYVYVTANHSAWMGTLAGQNSQVKNAPFNNFVLAGAHDSGMSYQTTQQMSAWLGLAEEEVIAALILFAPEVFSSVIFDTLAVAALAAAPQILLYLAFTQKDTVTTMLNLGIRYFDFRPGYCYNMSTSAGIFHQHMVIPGNSLTSFITDVVNWLISQPTEIVVVSLNFSGFQTSSMQPSSSTLYQVIDPIINGRIAVGNKTNLSQTYAALIASNTRLIFLNSTDSADPNTANQYNSYWLGNYETTNPTNVVNAISAMSGQTFATTTPAYDYSVMQLQGTAQASASSGFGDFLTTLSLSQAASPLMSTKALFDSNTYPVVLKSLHSQMDFNNTVPLTNRSLMILLNDFCDNALVDVGIAVTLQRCTSPAP